MIPHWMKLSHLAEDAAQIAAMVELLYHTPAQREAAMAYELRRLRRHQWDRKPGPAVKRPPILRPSKLARGYRTDPSLKREARMKLAPEKRAAIASAGAVARKERQCGT